MDTEIDPFLQNLKALKKIIEAPSETVPKQRHSIGSYSSNHRFFEKEKRELEKKLKDTEDAGKKEKALRESLESSFDNLTSHRKELTKQLEDEKAQRSTLQEQLDALTEKVAVQKAELEKVRKDYEDKLAQSGKELEVAESKRKVVVASLDEAKSREEDLNRQLEEHKMSLSKLNEDCERERKSVDKVKRENATLAKDLSAAKEALTEETEKRRLEAEKSTNTYSALEKESDELRAEIKRLTGLLPEANQTAAAMPLYDAREAALKALENQLSERSLDLEERKKVSDEQETKIVELENEVARLKGMLGEEKLTAEETEMANVAPENDDLVASSIDLLPEVGEELPMPEDAVEEAGADEPGTSIPKRKASKDESASMKKAKTGED